MDNSCVIMSGKFQSIFDVDRKLSKLFCGGNKTILDNENYVISFYKFFVATTFALCTISQNTVNPNQ